MGYPKMDEEVSVVLNSKAAKAAIKPVATKEQIVELSRAAEEVHVAQSTARYAVQIVSATRTMAECSCGASPRGSISLIGLARAWALLQGRAYVLPDDVKFLAPYVLGHRIILTHEAKINGRTPEAVVSAILESVAVPAVSEAEVKGL